MHRAIRYLGLYKPTRENMRRLEEKDGKRLMKRYNGRARRYLNLLKVAILNKKRGYAFPLKARDEKEVLRRLLNTLRTLRAALAP